jgi:hypothetical protein
LLAFAGLRRESFLPTTEVPRWMMED